MMQVILELLASLVCQVLKVVVVKMPNQVWPVHLVCVVLMVFQVIVVKKALLESRVKEVIMFVSHKTNFVRA